MSIKSFFSPKTRATLPTVAHSPVETIAEAIDAEAQAKIARGLAAISEAIAHSHAAGILAGDAPAASDEERLARAHQAVAVLAGAL